MDRADVAIIGGGLIGCATAWRLALAGASVVLFEAGDVNTGASGQNAGSLHFQIERRFLENGDALADQAAAIVALSRLAVEDWRKVEQDLGADLHVAIHGGLMVAETAEEVALLERKAERERREGLSVETFDGAAARAIAPYLSDRIMGANFSKDEGHADPKAMTPALAAAARGAGADLRMHTPVATITRVTSGFSLGGNGWSLAADRVLVAAGAWTAPLCARANLHMPLYPVALLMNATVRVPPTIPHLVQHVGRRLSLKQTHAGNLLIGGGWPSRLAQSADGGFDLSRKPALIAGSLSGNLRAATDVVPQVAALDLLRSWTGVTAISADQLPIVGEVPRMPGLYVAAGGSAFTLGLTFARLLAAAMTGRPTPELDIVSPARFEHLNGFMG
ncbi:NAD(P)/FAD-dependent oxidoreductase [Sphingomonas dokdonensis]|uniref:4-methylaminobutanoate oxidase (Formaldehyde-forming) n=1 Tax=Sphingomonas dokdonensis TaxID=344880 RepID=A0A245ZV58_9SPHN|nr:FAD-dependent oxidoreductase [Sphingomonas dokdonensis]OWK33621.1 4-methylaminobutanoate oxidase (formaldehyde-forming) [Sphingomonas dokdonensis]